MDIVLAVPLLVIGAFLLLGWYINSRTSKSTKPQRWRFILILLLINYMLLYFIYMVSDIIFWEAIDFLSIPGILLPSLLGIFITGFILSWRHEFYAGVFFLLWYFLVLIGQLRFEEILHRGPYMFLGVTILLHGVLYLYYHFRVKQGFYGHV